MTREQAIDLLDNLIGMVEDNRDSDYDTALKMGIKALEHERRFIVHADGRIEQIREAVADWKPQLVAEPKTGHWIMVDDKDPIAYDCSECDAMVSRKFNYCPNCGAKMKSEE